MEGRKHSQSPGVASSAFTIPCCAVPVRVSGSWYQFNTVPRGRYLLCRLLIFVPRGRRRKCHVISAHTQAPGMILMKPRNRVTQPHLVIASPTIKRTDPFVHVCSFSSGFEKEMCQGRRNCGVVIAQAHSSEGWERSA